MTRLKSGIPIKPGDLILVNGSATTLLEIRFHAPSTHAVPQHQAAIEIVTRRGSQWFAFTPQV